MKYLYTAILALLLSGNHCLAIKPKKDYITTPAALGLHYKEQKISTPDNFQINTWTLYPEQTKDKKIVMVLAYGDAMNMSYWLEQSTYFLKAGFTVVTFDYRGFGQSSPFAIDSNRLYYNEFATDLCSVITFAQKQFKGYKVGIRALSMGTIMSILANDRAHYDFLIADNFVCNLPGICSNILKEKKRTITLPAGADKYDALLDKMNIPMLVFAGTEDNFTPLADSKTLVARHKNSQLITYKGGHMQAIYSLSGATIGEKYINDVSGFLKEKGIMR